ncbi:GNAT family N-acetyltransferase [Paenibacillus sp. M1]|uniref:GNAT family N-acetyltransferase n=1 Tax=Paenibacillus haidiansis TaxID=1574488 RepID=A0ABU7VZC8_9BACL
MRITAWRPGEGAVWEQQHAEMLAFVHRFGRKGISAGTYRALMRLTGRDLLLPGASLLLATVQTEDGPRIAGLSCITEYGRGIGLVVVHPLYRGRGLGSGLLSRQLSTLGKLSFRVAPDNISCLKMCFRAGFAAGGLAKTPGGKPELMLEKKPEGWMPMPASPELHHAAYTLQRR